MQDPAYKDFHTKLIPTVDPDTTIGVRTLALRKLAKELSGTPETDAFLQALPRCYYHESNLHGFLVERIGDYDAAVEAIDAFLPYVDNLATCELRSVTPAGKNVIPKM